MREAQTLIAAKRSLPGAMLPILHALQERYGYIDDAAIPLIAEALNLSKAEMLGVVSFYHDFRRRPTRAGFSSSAAPNPARRWAARIWSPASSASTASRSTNRADAPLCVETVYCLGNCALSPAALIDGEPIGRLDADRIDALVAAARGRRQ